ncbi:MAG TPA: DUF5723 family protein [Cytophagaceae bacterium]|nr:DUF5723 family protein [Cytophagaceae bacterium]
MKKIILTSILSFCCTLAFPQAELSTYSATGRAGVATTFATDYQAIGINPANLGFGRVNEGKKFTLGFLEAAGNVYHQGLSNKDFSTYGLHYKNVTTAEKITAAQKFASNTISANLDFMLFGVAFQDEKFGGLAITVRESFRYYSKLTGLGSDYLFRGATSSAFDSLILSNGAVVANNPNNYSSYQSGGVTIDSGKANIPFSVGKVIGNSKIKQHWYRDYAISYGRKVLDKNGIQLYAGVGAKYVAGYNYIDISSDGNVASGKVALNPITKPIQTLGVTSPSNTPNNNYQAIGNGYGFDLGLTLSIKQKYKIGVSAVNIGSVTYTKNVYSLKDSAVAQVVYRENEGFKGVGQIVAWNGEKKLVVALPAMLRAGASVSLFDYKMELGFDAVIPLNDAAGNFTNPLIAVGGDYKILKTIKLSSGFSMGGNTAKKFNLPLGVMFSFNNTLEFGVASRDVLSYFLTTGNSYSLAVGVLRIRI